MEQAMTKSKTIVAALAALTLTASIAATSDEAQARPRFGAGLGLGFAAGALVGIAASGAYASPGYVVDPGYRECRYVERFDRWGNVRTIKLCDVAPY
jgi:hypothetical protein